MKLTLQELKEKKEDFKKAQVGIPSYDIQKIRQNTYTSPIWLHFGAGNIFRAFIARIADTLLEKGLMDAGLVAAEMFGFDIIDCVYKDHDNLVLCATLCSNGEVKKDIYASIQESLKCSPTQKDYKRCQEIFCNKSLQMVSFTITEKGYATKDASGAILPLIQKDIECGPKEATSSMGQLTSLLFARFCCGAFPLAVVSMDNCSQNGKKLQDAVLFVAQQWQKKGFVKKDFIDYLKDEKKITFPWTMIDKITPRPADSVEKMLEDCGFEEIKPFVTKNGLFAAPFVNAEKCEYLVVEDNFPNGRPPLENAGVLFAKRDTVNLAEKMKVTACLNPLHTALAVYGCLLGFSFIKDEMKDEALVKLVKKIGLDEGLPVVEDPKILNPRDFVMTVINQRLPNPFMPDAPQRIATDTSQKVPIRFGNTIKAYMQKKGTAKDLLGIPLALAGWLRYLLAVDDKGGGFDLSSDPAKDYIRGFLKDIQVGFPDTYKGQIRPLLKDEKIFGVDLCAAGLADKIEDFFVQEIKGAGAVRKTLQKYLE